MWERVFGPLVELECRRTLARSWLLWFRVIAAVPAVFLLLFVLWILWLFQSEDATVLPGSLLSGGFCFLEIILVAGAMLLGPALISASLAGDKARGMITLLLAGNVSARDVVLGRMSGGLLTANILLIGSFPVVAAFAGWGGLNWRYSLAAFLLPISTLLGSGGLALALSSVAKRGRDALLTSFVLLLLWMIGLPFLFRFLPPRWAVIGHVLSPFQAAVSLTLEGSRSVWWTCAMWCAFSLAGVMYAAWRIRPAFLSGEADNSKRIRIHARRKAKRVGTHPMLWKEIHFEQQAYGTRIGQMVAKCFFAFVFLATVGLAAWAIISETYWPKEVHQSIWARETLTTLTDYLDYPLRWLFQWWLGIRAATGIVAERERDTWDPLLLSPLEAREIVRGKILGALYAMRWLLLVISVIWVVPTMMEIITVTQLLQRVALTLAAGAFMASVGVYCSLVTRSTGAATALVMGMWCAAALISMIASLLASAILMLFFLLVRELIPQDIRDFLETNFGSFFQSFGFLSGMNIIRVLLYLLAAYLVGLLCRHSFDRLSGRKLRRRRGAPIPPSRPVPRRVH